MKAPAFAFPFALRVDWDSVNAVSKSSGNKSMEASGILIAPSKYQWALVA